MNTLRGVERYAIKQVYKERASKRTQNTIEFLNEAIKRQCADYDHIKLPFRKFLTDNPDILDTLLRAFDEPGSRTLFVSPCGSGKTFMVCSSLAEAMAKKGSKGKATVLLTPNAIQSDQNGKYYYEDPKTGEKIYVIPITANNKNDIKIEPGHVYSVVYDSANSRFEMIPYELLRMCVVIVDEAHQFESASDYRGPVLNQLREIIKEVCFRGGNVMYMTGTPRRIMGYNFDHLVECYKIDENGEPVNELNVGEVELYLNNKRNSIVTASTKLVLDVKEQGGRALTYLNTKKKIRQCDETLKEMGLEGSTITADKKGRTVEEIEDEFGFTQKVFKYASQEYKALIESDALTDKKYYYVTSVLNAGTSIKGILMKDGEVVQDPSLVPIYACSRSTEFDLDDLTQFFARPRFNVTTAKVLINKQQTKPGHNKADFVDCFISVGQSAVDALEAEKSGATEILRMPTLDGKTMEDYLITLPNGQRDINIPLIYSQACVMYYQQVANDPELLPKVIAEELGVPCKVIELSERIDLQVATPQAVDPQVRDLAMKAIKEDPKFFKDIIDEKFNVYATQIRPLDGGKKVLQNMKNLYMSGRFKTEQIVEAAIGMVESRRAVAVDKDGIIVNPKTEPVDDLLRQLSKQSLGAGFEHKFVKFVEKYEETGDPSYVNEIGQLKDDELKNKVKYFIGTSLGFKKLKWLAKIWNEANGAVRWKKACEIVANTKETELFHTYRSIIVTGLNKRDFYAPGNAYTTAVQQYRLLSGAEYHALRYYKDGFEYVDEEYAEEEDIEVRKAHTSLHFEGGLDGKTVSKYDCEQIGLQFIAVLKKMGLKCNRTKPYTWKEIDKGIRAEFRCYNVRNTDGRIVEGKIRIKGLRQSVRGMFGEAPLVKEEVLANYDAIMMDQNYGYEDKIVVLSHIVSELVELGYTKEQAERARDAVVSGLEFDEGCPFTEDIFHVPYVKGTLQLILDAEKANPAKEEALSVEDAARILTFSTEANLDARTKKAYEIIEDMRTSLASCDQAYRDFQAFLAENGTTNYVSRFDHRAVPTDLDEIEENDRPAAILVAENAAYEHKFFWDGEWYKNPQEAKDAGNDVDPRVSVFWRTDKDAYRGWINLYGTASLIS